MIFNDAGEFNGKMPSARSATPGRSEVFQRQPPF